MAGRDRRKRIWLLSPRKGLNRFVDNLAVWTNDDRRRFAWFLSSQVEIGVFNNRQCGREREKESKKLRESARRGLRLR